MSATDELRRMLDERGVEWESKDVEGVSGFHDTRWNAYDVRWCYVEFVGNNYTKLKPSSEFHCTPEQAIAATLGGECKWVWVESWTDTTDGRECDYAHWMPDCGCWSEYDHRFSDFDDYAEKPTGIAFCERCGKAVKR